MRAGIFATPRPEPGHVVPALAGTLVIVVALPIFLVAGWSLAGWTLAAVMWAGVHALDLLLRRSRARGGNLAASGVQAFGLLFKSIALLVVLIATAATRPGVALALALTYGIAYTLELGLGVLTYFGGSR